MITSTCRFPGHSDGDRERTSDSTGEQLRRFLSEIQKTIQHASHDRQTGEKLQKLIYRAQHLEGDAAQILMDAILVGECLAWACLEEFLTPPSGCDSLG